MNRHEAAFLDGVLHAGDPVHERRLLVGYGLMRAICAIRDGEPRSATGTRALIEAEESDAFAGAATHLAHLRHLADCVDDGAPSRRALHSALVDYACHIALEDHTTCALAAISLSEAIWDNSCDEERALRAFYRHAVIMVRGQKPIEECQELCLILAVRARRARSALHRGFARLLQVDVLMYRGVLPKARASARRLEAYGTRAGFPELVANAQLRLAAIEGRAGAYEEALGHTASAFQTGRHDPLLQQNALNIMARALTDLGRLDDARRAYELATVSERSAVQTLVMLGLMDLALLAGDLPRFLRLRARVASGPIAPAHRTFYLKLAALGEAALGNVPGARALLEEGRQLARTFGFNHEYLDLDTELTRLSEREAAARSAPVRMRQGTVDEVLREIALSHRSAIGAMEAVFA